MTFKFKKETLKELIPLLILILTSAASVALVRIRWDFSGHLRYLFLVWNLILAWMPVFFAWFASWRLGDSSQPLYKRPFGLAAAGLWLLFLPNAPYIVTDMLHLRPTPTAPYWYDIAMLILFASTGLMLGFLSLDWMQTVVQRRYGVWPSWFFAFGILGLSGMGVYIGRVLRWNSWDLIRRPTAVLADIFHNFVTPELALRAWGLSILLVGMLVGGYLLLASWRREVEIERLRD